MGWVCGLVYYEWAGYIGSWLGVLCFGIAMGRRRANEKYGWCLSV
jgi:hypothetical protein